MNTVEDLMIIKKLREEQIIPFCSFAGPGKYAGYVKRINADKIPQTVEGVAENLIVTIPTYGTADYAIDRMRTLIEEVRHADEKDLLEILERLPLPEREKSYEVVISAEIKMDGFIEHYGVRIVIKIDGHEMTSPIIFYPRKYLNASSERAISFGKEIVEVIKRAKVVVRK